MESLAAKAAEKAETDATEEENAARQTIQDLAAVKLGKAADPPTHSHNGGFTSGKEMHSILSVPLKQAKKISAENRKADPPTHSHNGGVTSGKEMHSILSVPLKKAKKMWAKPRHPVVAEKDGAEPLKRKAAKGIGTVSAGKSIFDMPLAAVKKALKGKHGGPFRV